MILKFYCENIIVHFLRCDKSVICQLHLNKTGQGEERNSGSGKASTVQQFLSTFTSQNWIIPQGSILPLKSMSIPGLTQSITVLPHSLVMCFIFLVSFSWSPNPILVLNFSQGHVVPASPPIIFLP